MDFKAAIFDMDGTLINSLIFWDYLWAELGKRFLNNKDFKPSVEDDKKVRTATYKDAMQLIHDNYNICESGEQLLCVANELLIDFYSNTVELKSGVKEYLEYLKSKNIKMCVASATARDMVILAMKHCGIEEYFLEVFSCADLGKGKDEPDIYLQTVKFLGEEIEDICLFEDSVVAIETATKIGLPTVAIYDCFNYGQERMREIANEYIADGETLLKLVK